MIWLQFAVCDVLLQVSRYSECALVVAQAGAVEVLLQSYTAAAEAGVALQVTAVAEREVDS